MLWARTLKRLPCLYAELSSILVERGCSQRKVAIGADNASKEVFLTWNFEISLDPKTLIIKKRTD